MIILYCGLRQDDIINEIEKYNDNGQQIFKFIKKENIKIYFETTLKDEWQGCSIINGIVSNYKYGKALFVNALPCDGENVSWFNKK